MPIYEIDWVPPRLESKNSKLEVPYIRNATQNNVKVNYPIIPWTAENRYFININFHLKSS